jgi:hypothetical protein
MPESQRPISAIRADLHAEREALGKAFEALGDDLVEARRQARGKAGECGKKAAKYGGAAGGGLGALGLLRGLVRRRRKKD